MEILTSLTTQEAFLDVNLSPVLTRLDLATQGLPDNPEQAAADLDIAWELLSAELTEPVEAVDDVTPAPTPTPTPES